MVTAILVKLFTSVVASSSNPGRTGFLSGHKWEGLVATVQMDFLQPVDGYQLPANVHSFLRSLSGFLLPCCQTSNMAVK